MEKFYSEKIKDWNYLLLSVDVKDRDFAFQEFRDYGVNHIDIHDCCALMWYVFYAQPIDQFIVRYFIMAGNDLT